MLEVELDERSRLMGEDYKPLSKAEALKHIEDIEMIKVKHMAGAVVAKNRGQIQDSQLQATMAMCPILTMDQYTGKNQDSGEYIEEQDILIAMNKYQLAASSEL